MTGKLPTSLARTATSAGRPRSCAPAAVSATALACHRQQIQEQLRPNRGLSGKSRVKKVSIHGAPFHLSFERRQ